MGIHYKIKQTHKHRHTYNMPEFLKTKAEYEQAITEMCVIDFTASWCPPCRRIAPKFEEMSKDEAYEGIKFYKIDVDDNSDASAAAGISCMPTFQFYKDGQKADELQGANESELRSKLAALKK